MDRDTLCILRISYTRYSVYVTSLVYKSSLDKDLFHSVLIERVISLELSRSQL